jgi:hypothetical protein
MRNCLTLICVLLCWLEIAEKNISAQIRTTAPQICSPAMLDVSALPGPPSFTFGGHVFVLQVQNISPAACSLEPPQVALLPSADTNNQPFYAAWRGSDPDHKSGFEPQVLASGAWAHLLFAWTSRAGPELSCDLYSGVRLGFSYQWQERKGPEVEIRHLWIRACGPFAVSGYRLGEYLGTSPVPKSWLEWYGPGGLPGLTFSLPTPSAKITSNSPLLSLSAQAKRTMLGDRVFSLKLNFPRSAAEGCAFSQLRKREADGSTVLSIQQCDDVVPDQSARPPVVPWHQEPGVMGLAIGNLDLDPKHVGPLEYDVLAPIGRRPGQGAALQYARTRVDLIVRDPALPRQVAVLDPLPPCTASQLRIVSLSPTISTALKTLRAYNATNISPQACSLAGVPRTRGIDEEGHYQPFLPLRCPNCENELFTPHPNGRIDLNQGETAHLLAAATGNGKGYCISTPRLEFSLNRDASITTPLSTGPLPEDTAQSTTVPFAARDCVSIDISAWRQGPYDGDPLDLHRTKLAPASVSAPTAPIPDECNKPELLAHGTPYPMEGTHDPEYGISMEQHQFLKDEPIPLYLWTNNSKDHPIELGLCRPEPPAYLRAGGFVLYDGYGHRILSKRQLASDERCKADPSGYNEPLMCTDTVSFLLPAHTCTSSRINLARDYELPPGDYTISTRDPGDHPYCPKRSDQPFKPNAATDISFKVLQP